MKVYEVALLPQHLVCCLPGDLLWRHISVSPITSLLVLIKTNRLFAFHKEGRKEGKEVGRKDGREEERERGRKGKKENREKKYVTESTRKHHSYL